MKPLNVGKALADYIEHQKLINPKSVFQILRSFNDETSRVYGPYLPFVSLKEAQNILISENELIKSKGIKTDLSLDDKIARNNVLVIHPVWKLFIEEIKK